MCDDICCICVTLITYYELIQTERLSVGSKESVTSNSEHYYFPTAHNSNNNDTIIIIIIITLFNFVFLKIHYLSKNSDFIKFVGCNLVLFNSYHSTDKMQVCP